MFQTGDRVIYGIHGVCTVTGLETQTSGGKENAYLVLEPLMQSGSRYLVPTHNASAMGKLKKMLTREEFEAMMQSSSVRKNCWMADEGLRKQTYRELITSGDREQIMAMVYTLYQHKKVQSAAGRKIHLCDENFLRDAEKLLAGEAEILMGLDQKQAVSYIRSGLKAE